MRKNSLHFGNVWKRFLAVVAAVSMLATLMPIGAASAATVSTGYQVEINETITGGFTHPGVGLTKATLGNDESRGTGAKRTLVFLLSRQ